MTHRAAIWITAWLLLLTGVVAYFFWYAKQHEHEVLFREPLTVCDCTEEFRDARNDFKLMKAMCDKMFTAGEEMNKAMQAVFTWIAEDRAEMQKLNKRLEKIEKQQRGCW